MAIGSRTISVALLLGLTWGGCSDDSGARYQEGLDEEMGGEDADVPAPFSRPFDGLVMNRARWAEFEVATKAARIERGMNDTWNDDDEERTIHPAIAYVEVDLELTNTSKSDSALSRRSTWDLILADGTRIEQRNYLALKVGPAATVPFTLRYEVDPALDLTGSSLELNGSTRGELAPELVSLDAPYRADVDINFSELEGRVLESSRPDDFDRRRIEILSAKASRNSVGEGRAPYGSIFVELVVDATVLSGGFGDTYIEKEDFSALIGGKVYEPGNHVSELIPVHTTKRMTVVFSVSDQVDDLTLRFVVGSDPDRDPDTELAAVDIRL